MDILSQHIHDNRFLRLIRQMLQAGYLEEWRWHETLSGAPQGGVCSPILSNIYLDKLDTFVETVLLPKYNREKRRAKNPAYQRIENAIARARRRGDRKAMKALRKQRRTLPSQHPQDPNYRRLRYVRYADDVRHVTQDEILLAEKGGSEDDDLRVISPTWRRKPKGKGACEKRRKRVKALMRCPARPA